VCGEWKLPEQPAATLIDIDSALHNIGVAMHNDSLRRGTAADPSWAEECLSMECPRGIPPGKPACKTHMCFAAIAAGAAAGFDRSLRKHRCRPELIAIT
jgi:hypothetical protein